MQLGISVSDNINPVCDNSVLIIHSILVVHYVHILSISYNVFQATEADLTIIIGDANDRRPIFLQPSYDITIKEVSQTYLSSSFFYHIGSFGLL